MKIYYRTTTGSNEIEEIDETILGETARLPEHRYFDTREDAEREINAQIVRNQIRFERHKQYRRDNPRVSEAVRDFIQGSKNEQRS